jgi:hypothetical protein
MTESPPRWSRGKTNISTEMAEFRGRPSTGENIDQSLSPDSIASRRPDRSAALGTANNRFTLRKSWRCSDQGAAVSKPPF